ncbi:MAG: abortive phage resistance protein [Deltaproteobacteria bacterium RIFOXYD12_FULL_50_9]|nr:MAG: abortive phage resistance protein [Deltaproteobacteria bacterium RIFOXYD12_FULL_50_9]
MLISFSVENFLSFKDKATFSMVASREKQHQERLVSLQGQKLKLLPIAAIYGGNASGKTNFCQAISFARHQIVIGNRPDARIPVEPFGLSKIYRKKPSGFVFEILVGEQCFEYGFYLNSKQVEQEWLVEILKTTEKDVYRRTGDSIVFRPDLDKDQFMHFAFKGTRENQLFLTNSVNQKIEEFKPIYEWFRSTLLLIAPDTRFEAFEQFIKDESPLYELMNDALVRLDTGIAKIGGEEIPFDSIPMLPLELRNQIKETLAENKPVRIRLDPNGDRYVVELKEGKICAQKLMSLHIDADNEEVKFDLRSESDGSLRLIDLLPAFLGMTSERAGTAKVLIIDELDRSLHTLLTSQLLKSYLADCGPETRSQLLITTHDVLLMDQDLLRRDEMWVAERDTDGSSELIAFSDYKEIRSDKDIRKSYLQGRLGGIPKILLKGSLKSASNMELVNG